MAFTEFCWIQLVHLIFNKRERCNFYLQLNCYYSVARWKQMLMLHRWLLLLWLMEEFVPSLEKRYSLEKPWETPCLWCIPAGCTTTQDSSLLRFFSLSVPSSLTWQKTPENPECLCSVMSCDQLNNYDRIYFDNFDWNKKSRHCSTDEPAE